MFGKNLFFLSLIVLTPPSFFPSPSQYHFHPSVRKFAEGLEAGGIDYRGDPLKDFQLAPFLDRFSFKNPKSKEKLKKKFRLGESIAERKSGGRGLAVVGGVAVNDPAYLNSKVGVEEEFFYRYMSEKSKRDVIKGVKKGADVNVALEDAEVDNYGDVDADWDDADDSEEEFAQGLAEKLMENHGNGKAHFDEEDVDFSMSSSDEEEDEDLYGEIGSEGREEEEDEEEGRGDEEEDSDGDSEDGSEDGSEDDSENDDGDDDGFMEVLDDSENSEDDDSTGSYELIDAPSSDDEEEVDGEEDDDEEEEGDAFTGMFEDDSEEEEEVEDENDEEQSSKKGKKNKKKRELPSYEEAQALLDADDFWKKRDAAAVEGAKQTSGGAQSEEGTKKKRRKSRKKA